MFTHSSMCLGKTDAASVVFVDYDDGGAEVNSEGKKFARWFFALLYLIFDTVWNQPLNE